MAAEGHIRLPCLKSSDIVMRLLILRLCFVKRGESIGIKEGGIGLIGIQRLWEARCALMRGIYLV